jgi:hypothetical protein
MDATSRYCNLWRIDPAGDRPGYSCYSIPSAKEFFDEQGLNEIEKDLVNRPHHTLHTILFSHAQRMNGDATEHATLCLRCYVSEPILNACKKIDRLFGEDQSFTYRDLLPFVLNDDGTPQPTVYRCFSLQILQTFKPQAQPRMSLDNWAYLQTKQNPDLKNFLSEFGFKSLSDWALFNRTRPKQLEQLAERDRHLIEVFHAIYRRDRRQQNQGTKRCVDPTTAQLQEMVMGLQTRNITLQPTELMTELRRVALQLRQYDLWSYREPLELDDPETGDSTTEHRTIRSDLPQDDGDCNLEQQEQEELLVFFYEQLYLSLADAIGQGVSAHLTYLKKSKGYAPFADQFMPGLLLYYRQGIALKEIADLFHMSGWAQARRVLNPGELIHAVRRLTIRQVLAQMLKKAAEKGLTRLPPEPNYVENLAEQIEALADGEIFQEAFEEIQAGKNRLMQSVYAQKLCSYLEACTKVA